MKSSAQDEENKIEAFDKFIHDDQAGGSLEQRGVISLNSTPYTITTDSKQSQFESQRKNLSRIKNLTKGNTKGKRRIRRKIIKIKGRKKDINL